MTGDPDKKKAAQPDATAVGAGPRRPTAAQRFLAGAARFLDGPMGVVQPGGPRRSLRGSEAGLMLGAGSVAANEYLGRRKREGER